jgi:hypothetical protein
MRAGKWLRGDHPQIAAVRHGYYGGGQSQYYRGSYCGGQNQNYRGGQDRYGYGRRRLAMRLPDRRESRLIDPDQCTAAVPVLLASCLQLEHGVSRWIRIGSPGRRRWSGARSKEAIGKVTSDAKLETEGKADKLRARSRTPLAASRTR